jgi:aspartate/methionine/tyrosine aminotransferase
MSELGVGDRLKVLELGARSAKIDLADWSVRAAGLSPPGAARHAPVADPAREAAGAVVRYLQFHGAIVGTEQVALAPSLEIARQTLLEALAAPGEEVLVPSPWGALLGEWSAPGVRLVPYPLRYDGTWRLDRRALERQVGRQTRAILLAAPAHPTGGCIDEGELEAIAALCHRRGLALIGDEALLDTAFDDTPSVVSTVDALAIHVSGLAAVTGVEGGPAWIACAGPERLRSALLARLQEALGPADWAWHAGLASHLDGRGEFLGALRRRLAVNRAMLELAALREAPWSALESGGGWAGLLHIGGARSAERLCAELVASGVRILPAARFGLRPDEYLVVSLLTEPLRLQEGLEVLERRLRTWP